MNASPAGPNKSIYFRVVKPLGDRLAAFVLFVILLPLLLLVAISLAIGNRGKVWFIQERPGYLEKSFRVIKFRTMRDLFDQEGSHLSDELRLHKLGKFIRATSLDELPQLLNVMAGNMSFVGPRPLLMEYRSLYNETQRRRHLVRPGITGWAQVNGRNAISWPAKFAYDNWYVDHISFALDVKIIFLTLIKVIRSDGITSATSATMEKFRGND